MLVALPLILLLVAVWVAASSATVRTVVSFRIQRLRMDCFKPTTHSLTCQVCNVRVPLERVVDDRACPICGTTGFEDSREPTVDDEQIAELRSRRLRQDFHVFCVNRDRRHAAEIRSMADKLSASETDAHEALGI